MSLSDVVTVGVVTLLGLAILGAGAYVASVGVGRIRVARALGDASPIPLGDVPDASGLVEFEGTARPIDDALEAPLSGSECLAYAVSVRARDGEGGPDGREPDESAESGDADAADATDTAEEAWSLDGQASASTAFAVDDGADRVAVDPANAVLSLDDWDTTQTAWVDAAALTADARARLDAVGLSTGGGEPEANSATGAHDRSDATTARQYREQRIAPGDDVHVFGGSVVDAADSSHPVTVAGDDWFEIAVGDRSALLPDRRRSGTMHVIFGALLAVPGVGFTLAGIVGLVTTVLL